MASVAFAAKTKTMWLDCSANFERFSYPDSIRYYVANRHYAFGIGYQRQFRRGALSQ